MSRPLELNSTGRCSACGGVVKNVKGRRLTMEKLTAVHLVTCPGIHRGRKS